MSIEQELSPPEQAIYMASSFYAELTANATPDEALIDLIEKLEPRAREVHFVTACGLKTNFTTVHEFPLELAEYAETSIGHLNDIVYCHAALVQILRAQEVAYQFSDARREGRGDWGRNLRDASLGEITCGAGLARASARCRFVSRMCGRRVRRPAFH